MSGFKEGRVVSVDGDSVTMDLLAGVVRYYLLANGTMYSDCGVSCILGCSLVDPWLKS